MRYSSLPIVTTLLVGLLQAGQVTGFASQAPFHQRSLAKHTITPSKKPPVTQLPIRRGTSSSGSTSLQAVPAALSALPLSQKIFLSCVLPSCLGFYRSEYGVSYAYGSATSLASFWIYKALMTGGSSWSVWHAGALMFYGVRLCLFLAYRELFTKRMKESVERIEEKAKSKGGRLKRAPFVFSVAGLYFGLCAPLLVSSQVSASKIPAWTAKLLKVLVATTWGGFIFAALGDFNKSIVKAIKGEDHLVTGGIYSFCRHPNYTGEIVGWTSNGLIALIAAAAAHRAGLSLPQLVGYLLASVSGALGLNFVLLAATKGLEKRQKEKYNESKEYKDWIESSWVGIHFPDHAEEIVEPHVTPEIELSDADEETGSGI